MPIDDRVLDVLRAAAERRMWGEVQFILRDGRVTFARTIETKRLDGGPGERDKDISSRG